MQKKSSISSSDNVLNMSRELTGMFMMTRRQSVGELFKRETKKTNKPPPDSRLQSS